MNQSSRTVVSKSSREGKSDGPYAYIGQLVASSYKLARPHAVPDSTESGTTLSMGEADRTGRIQTRTLSRSSSWTSISSQSLVTPGPDSASGESIPPQFGSPTLISEGIPRRDSSEISSSLAIALSEDMPKLDLNPVPDPPTSKLGDIIMTVQLESQTTPEVDPNQPPTIQEFKFDPNVPILSNLRDKPVQDLTNRITDIPVRPFFEGVYSNVWKGAVDLKQTAAIKCLRKQVIAEEKAHRRLRREVGTWWCLCHDNIVPLLGIVYDEKFGSLPAMVSLWYANGSAADYLGPKHFIPASQRIDLFRDVANGIHYLHTFDMTTITVSSSVDTHEDSKYLGTKLVHGDLKPLNVLIDDNGRARLCDFGLLRLVREHAPTGMTTTTPHTGTTRYLCYELVADDDSEEGRPTTASDIWALACIGLQFIYSRPPYADIDNQHKIRKAIETPKPPSLRPNGILGAESGLWDLFQQCWEIEPGKRPDSHMICQYLEENREELIANRQKAMLNDLSDLSN